MKKKKRGRESGKEAAEMEFECACQEWPEVGIEADMIECRAKKAPRSGGRAMVWARMRRADGRIEYLCAHGVGHGTHVHGCDFCCGRRDYPLSKTESRAIPKPRAKRKKQK